MITQKHFAKTINYNKNKGNTKGNAKKLLNCLLKKYLKDIEENGIFWREHYRIQCIYFKTNPNHPELFSYDFSSGVSLTFGEDFKNKVFIKEELEKELTKRGFSFEWKPQDDDEMWLNIYLFK